MASAKTSSFWLTESIEVAAAAAGPAGATIDLGSYIDVGDQQALAIESIDWILQRYDEATDTYSGELTGLVASNCMFGMQVTDLNRGTAMVRADDRALISSGAIYLDQANNIVSTGSDFFPDNYGPAAAQDARLVVNDQLYVTVQQNVNNVAANRSVYTCTLKCKIVKLSKSDWMAIAIQATAADN